MADASPAPHTPGRPPLSPAPRPSALRHEAGTPAGRGASARIVASSAGAPATDDSAVPAALAALLHQSDRSGRQQSTPGGAAQGAAHSGAPPSAAPQSSPEASSPPPVTTLLSLFCCCGSGSAAAASSPRASASSASGSNTTLGSARQLSAQSASSGDGVVAHASPPPLRARNGGDSATPSGGATPGGGADTPSKVLSPTSRLATRSRAAARAAVYERSSMVPWGSGHPAVVGAGGDGGGGTPGSARRRGGGGGSGTPRQVPPEAPLSPWRAATGTVSGAPQTPSGGSSSVGGSARRLGSPRALILPPGGLNAQGHPAVRLNNVRRPATSVGEGPLLAQLLDIDRGRHCLVLDLDETLVHSSFKPVPNPHHILPVEIEGVTHSVYVYKRPGCDEFLARMGKVYEVVVFTASLAKYADPLLDQLDPHNIIRARLFREACVYHEGNYVKDLSLLGRDTLSTIIVDNSPASFVFQPENALLCDSFIDDPADRQLYALATFLEAVAQGHDVREALSQWKAGTFVGAHGLTPKAPLEPEYESDEDDLQDTQPDVRGAGPSPSRRGGGGLQSPISSGTGSQRGVAFGRTTS